MKEAEAELAVRIRHGTRIVARAAGARHTETHAHMRGFYIRDGNPGFATAWNIALCTLFMRDSKSSSASSREFLWGSRGFTIRWGKSRNTFTCPVVVYLGDVEISGGRPGQH